MSKQAEIYRMETQDHICPFGLKALDLLHRKDFDVVDRPLKSRQQTDVFMKEHEVDTTPQIFINGERIGGYQSLRKEIGLERTDEETVSYRPIIAVFSTTLLMATMANMALTGEWLTLQSFAWFIAFSMCVLAILKLQDLESFSNQFLGYDLLAQRYVPYAKIYPFAEGLAGVCMIGGVLLVPASLVALFIGGIGAASVYMAVYIEKRELKCACVGGNSHVPLGFVSLTENLMIILAGIWMLST